MARDFIISPLPCQYENTARLTIDRRKSYHNGRYPVSTFNSVKRNSSLFLNMISAILFDLGGTLDSDGIHWLDRFYHIYEAIGLGNVQKNALKEAFYWADAQAEKDSTMRTSSFRKMVELHVHWQFQKLGLQNPQKEVQAVQLFARPAERILHRNRHVFETLSYAGFHLGIVSNNYGNLEIICREFGYDKFVQAPIDSAIVGFRKPDPRIFQLALEKLRVSAQQAAFVGDSWERDILPAKQLGMTAIWLQGDPNRACPDPAHTDGILRSLEELPQTLKALNSRSAVGA